MICNLLAWLQGKIGLVSRRHDQETHAGVTAERGMAPEVTAICSRCSQGKVSKRDEAEKLTGCLVISCDAAAEPQATVFRASVRCQQD